MQVRLNLRSILFPMSFLLFAGLGLAQMDNKKGSFKIPAAVDSTIPPKIKIEKKNSDPAFKIPLPNTDLDLPKNSPSLSNLSKLPNDSPTFFMMKKEEFADAGEKYTKAMNERQNPIDRENQPGHQEDQDLGTIKSKSNYVKIMCRDFGEVDGDRVTIYVNDEAVQSNMVLGGSFRGFQLPLNPGFNQISFKALNQGSVGANTAEFIILDETGSTLYSNSWHMLTGVKTKMMIIKE